MAGWAVVAIGLVLGAMSVLVGTVSYELTLTLIVLCVVVTCIGGAMVVRRHRNG